MMELHCDLINKLCISIGRCKFAVGQRTHKVCIIEQLLDLIASLIAAAAGRSSDIGQDVHSVQGAQCLALERSRLATLSQADANSVPERIEFTSEVLYCQRLLDVTPTDERLLRNPRHILQISDEIASIERQHWQCPQLDLLGSSVDNVLVCDCMREHIMCLVELLCEILMDAQWSDIYSEVVTVSDSIKELKETTRQQKTLRLGVRLYSTLKMVKTFCHQGSDSKVTLTEDKDNILESVSQILAQLPNWTKDTTHGHGGQTRHSVLLSQFCGFLNGIAKEFRDSSLEVVLPTGPSLLSGKTDWLEGMCRRVDERLEGYEECVVQLLTLPHLWEDEEWIACLENNSTALGTPSICKQLCDVVLTMSGQHRNPGKLNRLLKIFQSSFATLPPLTQNQICEDIWSHPIGHTLFSQYNQTGIHQELTTAFNRLVNVATMEEVEETIGMISHIALQSPSDTLQAAVTRAMSNSASIQSVIKILQMLPALACFKHPSDERPLLVNIFKDVINISSDMSTTEEANLIQVASDLLQPFKLGSSCPYQEQPLLSESLLMESCILPYLHCSMLGNDSYDNQAPAARLELCLKLLHVALSSFELKTQTSVPVTEWIPGISPFPIMLCLCDLLDQSHALWDRDAPSCLTPDSKELVAEILLRITDAIQSLHKQDKTFESGIEWLLKKTSDLYWTVQLQLGVCLQECLPDYKKAVPACLFDICDLSPDYWTAVPSIESDPATLTDQLVAFFQCCRISDQLSSQLYQMLKVKDNPNRLEFFQATLVAMTTVFPQSSLAEIERITSVVKLLIAETILHVPLSSQFLTWLPMFSYIDYRVALSMCQLFTSFVTLLASACCEDWVSLPLWVHTIRGVVIGIKNISSDIPTSTVESPLAPGSLFALSQILCHTCHMIRLVPSDVTDQLFVLVLDLMGMIEDLLANDSGQDGFEWTNERRSMEMVIAELKDGEQRKTLMQKLCSLKQ